MPTFTPPDYLLPWLNHPGSMTEKLMQASENQLTVRLLQEKKVASGWLREVSLEVNTSPWIVARTFIPTISLTPALTPLCSLGSQPLGSKLFASPHTHRFTQHICLLAPEAADYQLVTQRLPIETTPLWARYSGLRFEGEILWLLEIFLPTLPCFP